MSKTVKQQTRQCRGRYELEYCHGTSHKFWRIELNGASHTTCFGRVGTKGSSTTKQFDTPEKARASYEKLVQQKLDKGYVEANAKGASASNKKAKKKSSAKTVKPVSAEEAMSLFDGGNAPAGLTVNGSLNFSERKKGVDLPEGLSAWNINLNRCKWLKTLARGLSCFQLDAENTSLESLPENLHVELRLNLQRCRSLRELPRGLKSGSLILTGCTALEKLPEDFEATFLDISGCPQLDSWPKKGKLEAGRLTMRECTGMTQLPTWLRRISQLDISGCENITSFPRGLEVTSWIDVGRSGVRNLPRSLKGVGLRWRGVPVDERIAFHGDTITSQEVLAEQNDERRRAMMESMGFERFIDDAEAEVLDTDRDAGGERKLLRVRIKNDENLVCVSVSCPSTGRRYLIRVPPKTKTCKQAIAWTAGFDDPKEYRPAVET